MKFIAKFLLTILAIPVFVLLILSINIRFQFLSSAFWTNTLSRANVYAKISSVISDELKSKVANQGESEGDITILTNIVSPFNIKEFTESNLRSVLSYANGQSSEIFVYVPEINLLGKPLLVKAGLEQFIKDYNISGVSQNDLMYVAKLGSWSRLLFAGSIALAILILFLIYILILPGKRLGGMGIALVLPGLVILTAYILANFYVGVLIGTYAGSLNIGTAIMAVAAPSIVLRTIDVWISGAITMLVLGILLFFVKKPAKTNQK